MIIKFEKFLKLNEALESLEYKYSKDITDFYIFYKNGVVYFVDSNNDDDEYCLNLSKVLEVENDTDLEDLSRNITENWPNIIFLTWTNGSKEIKHDYEENTEQDIKVSKNFVDVLKFFKNNYNVEFIHISETVYTANDAGIDVSDDFNIDYVIREFEKYKVSKMPDIVYHGTCTKRLPNIMKKGIKPTPEASNFNNKHNKIIHDDFVFFTSKLTQAQYYAELSAKKTHSIPVILEINTSFIDKTKVYFDFDFYYDFIGLGGGIEEFDNIIKKLHDKDNVIMSSLKNKYIGATYNKFAYKGWVFPKFINGLYHKFDYQSEEFNRFVKFSEFPDFMNDVQINLNYGMSDEYTFDDYMLDDMKADQNNEVQEDDVQTDEELPYEY